MRAIEQEIEPYHSLVVECGIISLETLCVCFFICVFVLIFVDIILSVDLFNVCVCYFFQCWFRMTLTLNAILFLFIFEDLVVHNLQKTSTQQDVDSGTMITQQH